MSNIVTFETKNYNSSAHVSHTYDNLITVRVHKKGSSKLDTYFLPLSFLDFVQSLTSHTSLVAFAKDNQVNLDLQVKTSCPCPPEIPSTNDCDITRLGMDGGNSIFLKKDFTYINVLKGIKAQIESLNKYAFDKSIITLEEHYILSGIEKEFPKLISFDSVPPNDDLQLCDSHFSVNGSHLPDNLE